MKRILYSICIGSLALSVTAWGEQINDTKAKPRGGASVQAKSSAHTGSATRSQRHISTARSRPRTYSVTRQTHSVSAVNRSNLRNTHVQTFRGQNVRNANKVRARNNVTSNHARNLSVNRERNVTINRDRSVTLNRQRNVTVNNNWRGGRFSGQSYAAFRNYHRESHDRGWWRSHYNRIVFVDGGWYYWNAGYWFPAWGYAPYAYYSYDGPIYGYNNLAPDRVIVDVQSQLQRDGYYSGPIDGMLGPMTRQAITAFQSDHGLAITSAIDEPTLATLGLS